MSSAKTPEMSTKYELKCWLILNHFALLLQFLIEWSNFHNPVLRDRVVLNHINISATYSGPTQMFEASYDDDNESLDHNC